MWCKSFTYLNSFLATGLFLYHLKTSENRRLSNTFRGYRKLRNSSGMKWVNNIFFCCYLLFIWRDISQFSALKFANQNITSFKIKCCKKNANTHFNKAFICNKVLRGVFGIWKTFQFHGDPTRNSFIYTWIHLYLHSSTRWRPVILLKVNSITGFSWKSFIAPIFKKTFCRLLLKVILAPAKLLILTNKKQDFNFRKKQR